METSRPPTALPLAPQPLLTLPASHRAILEPFLPLKTSTAPPEASRSQIHLTLTYATSLDGCIALMPGTQTALSGPESKAMTHYLRSQHEAILVGVGTALVDDPGLNCRYEAELEVEGHEGRMVRQPVPVILDPNARWDPTGGRGGGLRMRGEGADSGESKVLRLAREGKGKGPLWIVNGRDAACRVSPKRHQMVVQAGGALVVADRELQSPNGEGVDWGCVLECLATRGIRSVMVEGGAKVIIDLLKEKNRRFVSSVVVTVAPVWLGSGGLAVCPPKETVGREVGRLKGVRWVQMGEDVVMAGKFND